MSIAFLGPAGTFTESALRQIEPRLCGRTLAGRSHSFPALRNLGEKPA